MCSVRPAGEDDSLILQSLADFDIRVLRFSFRPLEGLRLGPDEIKGDRWRGGLGEALRGLSCIHRWEDRRCPSCNANGACFYYYFFANTLPHPFVLLPDIDGKSDYRPGERIGLGMVLLGDAVAHQGKIVRTMEELGKVGIGAGRGRFAVKEVLAEQAPWLQEGPPQGDGNGGECRLELLSPLKLKEEEQGLYYDSFSFTVFMKLLLKRAINLNNLYGKGRQYDKERIEREKRRILAAADEAEVEGLTRWRDFVRYSSRQGKSMKIGGQTGMVRIRGNTGLFLPYLRLGESLGVGQHTTSGFGRYKVTTHTTFITR